MTAPIALSLFVVGACLFARNRLAHAPWTERSPALGIAAWQTLSVATALAVVLIGFTLALPELHLSADLAALLQACVAEMRHQYGTPAGMLLSGTGAAMSLGVIGRFGWALACTTWQSRRQRSVQRRRLRLLGEGTGARGVTIVEYDAPMVFCVPGRGSDIVVTSAAAEVLTEDELSGVLAHERAHLRARHHWAITVATALSATFWHTGLFATALARTKALVEMHADDSVHVRGRRDLASALVRLTCAAPPAGALGASGSQVAARVIRLTRPRAPLHGGAKLTVLLSMTAVLVLPVALALFPAGLALLLDCCRAGLRTL